jgi:hypothetical protein
MTQILDFLVWIDSERPGSLSGSQECMYVQYIIAVALSTRRDIVPHTVRHSFEAADKLWLTRGSAS